MLKKFLLNHKEIWKDKSFIASAVLSLLFLALSLFINYHAGVYANSSQSNSVSDILLDHLPIYNVDFIFFEGFSLLLISVLLIIIYKPRTIPFTLKSLSLFIFIRSIFITLTHLKEFPQRAFLDPNNIFQNVFTFGGDLFFSAHTGLPFLMALLFWKDKRLRLLFLTASIFFGVSVLLGHLHYSIDVFAAYFITYSIYKITQSIFRKDYNYSGL